MILGMFWIIPGLILTLLAVVVIGLFLWNAWSD